VIEQIWRVWDAIASIDWKAIGTAIGSAFKTIQDTLGNIDWERLGEIIGEVATIVTEKFGEVRTWFDANWPTILTALQTAGDGKGETNYFVFQCYQNNNIHLTFKRLDLVKLLNQVAGGGALKSGKNGR